MNRILNGFLSGVLLTQFDELFVFIDSLSYLLPTLTRLSSCIQNIKLPMPCQANKMDYLTINLVLHVNPL
jgi:hypothetical protein